MTTTWDEVEIRLWSKPWFYYSQTKAFDDENFRPLYYKLREEYSISRGITIEQFEAGVTVDEQTIEVIADRIYLDFEVGAFSFGATFTIRQASDYYCGLLMYIISKMTWVALMIPWIINVGQFELGKQVAFGAFVAADTQNRRLLIDYTDKLKSVKSFNNTLLIPILLDFAKDATQLYDESLGDCADTYRAIAESFDYEGKYKLSAVVEEINGNVAILAILPDKLDKITWPVEHTGQKASQFYAVGSIVNIAISQDNPLDISTWVKETHTVVNVHDGDTITLDNDVKIRVYPNNAPEMKNPDGSPNPAGVLSQQALSNLCLNQQVDVYIDPANPVDVYGRTLAYVYRNGVDLGQWMIDNMGNPIYYATNAWFSNIVYSVDEKFTTLDPNTEKYTHPEITAQEFIDQYPALVIKIPNYFMPFAAEEGDTVYLRISGADKTIYDTIADCSVPGEVHLVIAPNNLEYIKVAPDFLEKYVPSPCDKEVQVGIRYFYVCEEDVKEGEIKAVYDRIDGIFSVFNVSESTYEIDVPSDKVPGNLSAGDTAVLTFKPRLPYITFNVVVDSVSSSWVTLKTTAQEAPQTIMMPESLIPFPVVAGDKIGIEIGKNIGDYYVADFHARLGDTINDIASFVRMPDNDLEINIPMHVVADIVQDPIAKPDARKLQINDMAYFKIIDKSFVNSFKAELNRIDGANGVWKVLPDEKMEITIPSIVAQEFLTAQTYSSYPVCSISVKQLKASSSYRAEQELEIVTSDADNTVVKTSHIKFGNIQFMVPTRLFSWLPAPSDIGIFDMTNYSGLVSEAMYIDSISESDAKLISINKKDKGTVNYPIEKLPAYLKRFDVCRLQIRTHAWAKTPSGTVAQDIVDKYTKTKTLKSGAVKRKVPARVPNPLDIFVAVQSLDNGSAYAMTERLDNNGAVDIPVYMIPADTDVGDVLSLVVDSYNYTETYFTAQFMSLTPDGTCSFVVSPSMNYPFTIPLNMLPSFAVPTDVIGFRYKKKTARDTNDVDFYLAITAIGSDTITLKNNKTGAVFTLSQALLPYVILPAPDNDIINLHVGDTFKLEVSKIVGHSF